MTVALDRQLTTIQVAHRLGVSPQRVLQIADRLPHVRTPHGRLFDPAGVEAFAAQRAERDLAGASAGPDRPEAA